jgi:hypothetical protein
VRTLAAVVNSLDPTRAIDRHQLSKGDAVVVQTRNSLYRLMTLADGSFVVEGGWFSQQGSGPSRVGVAGCSFGGSAIWSRVVAAPGLFLEFGNGVRTTRIQSTWVEHPGARSSIN